MSCREFIFLLPQWNFEELIGPFKKKIILIIYLNFFFASFLQVALHFAYSTLGAEPYHLFSYPTNATLFAQ